MKPPLISICVPNLNKRAFLAERMATLLNQTVQDWEIIVCDSYSDDGSWEFFQKYKSDPRIQLHQVPRAGLYAGWNECLRRARGEYIYIATSDDTSSPALLKKLLEPLQRFPEIHLACCDYTRIDSQSKPLPDDIHDYRRFAAPYLAEPCIRKGQTDFLLHACFGTTWMTMASVLFRRRLLDQVGFFRTDQGSIADNDWSYRAYLATDIFNVPDRLATWRIYETQATPKRFGQEQVRLLQRCLKSVLDDPKSGLPSDWKSVPGWREKILAALNFTYWHGFNLRRWIARADPGRFWGGMKEAARLEPRWLLQQAARGFPVGPEPDPADLARELIQTFHAEWPPRKVSLT